MDDFLNIAIVGVMLSIIVNYTKTWTKKQGYDTRVVVVFLSIVLGAFYYTASDTVIWEAMLGILGAASTVYAFFLKDKKNFFQK